MKMKNWVTATAFNAMSDDQYSCHIFLCCRRFHGAFFPLPCVVLHHKNSHSSHQNINNASIRDFCSHCSAVFDAQVQVIVTLHRSLVLLGSVGDWQRHESFSSSIQQPRAHPNSHVTTIAGRRAALRAVTAASRRAINDDDVHDDGHCNSSSSCPLRLRRDDAWCDSCAADALHADDADAGWWRRRPSSRRCQDVVVYVRSDDDQDVRLHAGVAQGGSREVQRHAARLGCRDAARDQHLQPGINSHLHACASCVTLPTSVFFE